MNFLIILAVAAVLFMIIPFVGEKNLFQLLCTFGIGGVINSNFFHANAYPITAFGLSFGIDSVIFTLFIYCVILCQLKFSKKHAVDLTISSLGAIAFAAVIQLVAQCSSQGFQISHLTTFFFFVFSIIATAVAMWVMILVIEKMKSKNVFLTITVATVIATVINSTAYYGLSSTISPLGSSFGNLLLASLIGKFVALAFSLLSFCVLQKTMKPKVEKIEEEVAT